MKTMLTVLSLMVAFIVAAQSANAQTTVTVQRKSGDVLTDVNKECAAQGGCQGVTEEQLDNAMGFHEDKTPCDPVYSVKYPQGDAHCYTVHVIAVIKKESAKYRAKHKLTFDQFLDLINQTNCYSNPTLVDHDFEGETWEDLLNDCDSGKRDKETGQLLEQEDPAAAMGL